MGITIHFKATIDPVRLPALIDDVKDLAVHHGWPYTVIKDGEVEEHVVATEPRDETDEEEKRDAYNITDTIPVTGIILSLDQKCEGVSLLFDPDGVSTDLIGWLLVRDGEIPPEDNWTSVKTQFTRPEIHVAICELLKYLQRNFLKTLEVSDEGKYYETGDLGNLQRKQAELGRLIEQLAEGLSNAAPLSEEERLDPDALADRVEKIVRELWEREKGQP